MRIDKDYQKFIIGLHDLISEKLEEKLIDSYGLELADAVKGALNDAYMAAKEMQKEMSDNPKRKRSRRR